MSVRIGVPFRGEGLRLEDYIARLDLGESPERVFDMYDGNLAEYERNFRLHSRNVHPDKYEDEKYGDLQRDQADRVFKTLNALITTIREGGVDAGKGTKRGADAGDRPRAKRARVRVNAYSGIQNRMTIDAFDADPRLKKLRKVLDREVLYAFWCEWRRNENVGTMAAPASAKLIAAANRAALRALVDYAAESLSDPARSVSAASFLRKLVEGSGAVGGKLWKSSVSFAGSALKSAYRMAPDVTVGMEELAEFVE